MAQSNVADDRHLLEIDEDLMNENIDKIYKALDIIGDIERSAATEGIFDACREAYKMLLRLV